jgi:hypothetical protein
MFTVKEITKLGFDPKTVAELDNYAKRANASMSSKPSSTTNPTLATDRPRLDQSWGDDSRKYFFGPFPPDNFGGAGVTPPDLRIPLSALPDGNRGGVSMQMNVNPNSLSNDASGRLDKKRREVLESRPDRDRMAWPSPKKENEK